MAASKAMPALMCTVSMASASRCTTWCASGAVTPVRWTAASKVSPGWIFTGTLSGRVKPGWASDWVKAACCRAASAAGLSGLGWVECPSAAVSFQPRARAATPPIPIRSRGAKRGVVRRGSNSCIPPPYLSDASTEAEPGDQTTRGRPERAPRRPDNIGVHG